MSLSILPKFEALVEYCPSSSEEHQCVGRFGIYAYLSVTGTVQLPTPQPGVMQSYSIDGKILPQKITIPFAVDFSDTPVSNNEVNPCMSPVGSQAGSHPIQIVESVAAALYVARNYDRPGLPSTTVNESSLCIDGLADFMWHTNLFQVQAAGQAAAGANVPLLGPFAASGAASGAVGAGGSNYPLQVAWEICYADGCVATTIPSPSTASDGRSVYDNPQDPSITQTP